MISEFNDTIATANESGISSSGQSTGVFSSEIDSHDDVDLLKLELDAGDAAIFNIEAAKLGSYLDSVLRVFDSEGNEVAVDDDSNAPFEGYSLDSYIEFSPETSGDYYVGISSFANFDYDPVDGGNSNGNSDGEYTLLIDVLNDIKGTNESERINGTRNRDFIQGFDGDDRIYAGAKDDHLSGGYGDDLLLGGNGDDLILGEYGNDRLQGGTGNDLLDGGSGEDTLIGGSGSDAFFLDGYNEDTILDFQDGSDKIVLDYVYFEDLSFSTNGRGDRTSISVYGNTIADLRNVTPDLLDADDFATRDSFVAVEI